MHTARVPVLPLSTASTSYHCACAPLRPVPAVAVRDVLRRGIVERRNLFPENGPMQTYERWVAPAATERTELEAVEAHLAALEDYLTAADRGELLGRILALLSHYRVDPHAVDVEQRIADDWAEDLGIYPMWAVEEAARHWRRTRRFKPQICEMIELCNQAARETMTERDRLREVMGRSRRAIQPDVRAMTGLTAGMLRRIDTHPAD